jgi:hypothetical protein
MKDFVSLLKLPPKILAGLAIASGLLIFLPDNIISRLYMDSFKSNYGFVIGVVFIVSISILSTYTFITIGKSVLKKHNNKKLIKHRKVFLKKLDYEDKILIKEMMNQTSKTLELPTKNGTVIKRLFAILCGNITLIEKPGDYHLVSLFIVSLFSNKLSSPNRLTPYLRIEGL